MRASCLLPMLLLVAACFRPALPSGQYQCAITDDCPSGQECLGGLCWRPGEVDLATDPADLSVRSPDLYKEPPSAMDLVGADLTPVPCTGMGTPLTANVSACKGNFINLTAQRALCGTGFHVCEESASDKVQLAAALLTGQCAGVGGFYAARIGASIGGMNKVSCPVNGNDTATILGCGTEGGTLAFTNAACHGFSVTFACKGPGVEWKCTSTGLDGATHQNNGGLGGVLCCRN